MEKRLFWWEAGGAALTFVLGTLLHFLYEWSGEIPLVGAFAAVNESVWEHMKLLFVPMFGGSFLQAALLGSTYPNFPAARAAAVVTGLALIPVGFYTYTGVLGTHLLWVDIALFLAADAAAFALEFYLLHRGKLAALWQQILGFAVVWGLAFAFVWCTFHPPRIALFLADGGGI